MKQIILLLSVLVLACGSSEKPENLLPEEKMVDILTEVHLAESKISNMHLGGYDSSMVIYNYLEKKILKKYATDTGAYHASYHYYVKETEKYAEIYKQVQERLEKAQKTAIKKQKDKERLDSIAKKKALNKVIPAKLKQSSPDMIKKSKVLVKSH